MNYQVTSKEALSQLVFVCVVQTTKSEDSLVLYGDNICLLLRVKNFMDSFLSLMLNIRFIVQNIQAEQCTCCNTFTENEPQQEIIVQDDIFLLFSNILFTAKKLFPFETCSGNSNSEFHLDAKLGLSPFFSNSLSSNCYVEFSSFKICYCMSVISLLHFKSAPKIITFISNIS